MSDISLIGAPQSVYGAVHLGYVLVESPRVSDWKRLAADAIGMAVAADSPNLIAFRTDAHARRLIVSRSAQEDVTLGWEIDGPAALLTILRRLAARRISVEEIAGDEAALRGVERLWRFIGPKRSSRSERVSPKPRLYLLCQGCPCCRRTSSQFAETCHLPYASPRPGAPPQLAVMAEQLLHVARSGLACIIWSRCMDAVLSATDRAAMDIYARVERWALDEVALPGKLVSEIVELLYRENRFCRGILNVEGRTIGPENVSAPTLAIVNMADSIAPLHSVSPKRPIEVVVLNCWVTETKETSWHRTIRPALQNRRAIWSGGRPYRQR